MRSVWPLTFNLANRLKVMLVVLKCQKCNICISESEFLNFCHSGMYTCLDIYTYMTLTWVNSDEVCVVCGLRLVSLIWNTSLGCIIGMHALMLALHSVMSVGRHCLESPLMACPVKVNKQTTTQAQQQNNYAPVILFSLSSLLLHQFSFCRLSFIISPCFVLCVVQCASLKLINAVLSDPLTTVSGPLWLP